MTRVTTMLMVVATVGGTLIGCNRQQEATVEPSSAWVDPGCNPAEDCNELFESSTIRQHSEAAASYTELPEGCPYLPHEVPAVETLVDSTIPEFNAGRNRASNMNRGNQRLQDVDLHQHLMGVQGQIFACVDLAACYEDGSRLSGGGDLDFDFELSPNGRVAAVSVQPSPGLDHPSVVACARQAMYDYRFPSYDGGQMMIEYRMTIEEVDEEA